MVCKYAFGSNKYIMGQFISYMNFFFTMYNTLFVFLKIVNDNMIFKQENYKFIKHAWICEDNNSQFNNSNS